jgi:hypothetical protein
LIDVSEEFVIDVSRLMSLRSSCRER